MSYLIVVAIIGILAAIAIPNFLQAQVRAKVSRTQADLRTLALAMEMYQSDHQAYPPEYLMGFSSICEDRCYSQTSPDSVRSVRAEAHLTTPIEYTTNILYDVFTSRWDPPCYWYYNWLERYGRLLNPNQSGNAPSYDEKAAYGIMSMGPDHTASWPWPYDPTNGTISLGDIVRMGPGGGGSSK